MTDLKPEQLYKKIYVHCQAGSEILSYMASKGTVVLKALIAIDEGRAIRPARALILVPAFCERIEITVSHKDYLDKTIRLQQEEIQREHELRVDQKGAIDAFLDWTS